MTFPPSGHGVPASGSRARNTNRPREGFDPPDSDAGAKVPPQNATAGREAILAKLPELEEGPADRFAPDLLNAILQEYAPDLLLNDGGSSDLIQKEDSNTINFYRAGEGWILRFMGEELAFGHAEGFNYIKFLIDNAGTVYSPLELFELVTGEERPVSCSTLLNEDDYKNLIAKKRQMEEWLDNWESEEQEQFQAIQKAFREVERQLRLGRDETKDEYSQCLDKIRNSINRGIKKIKKQNFSIGDYLRKSIFIGAKCYWRSTGR